jgi:hypothetical protein
VHRGCRGRSRPRAADPHRTRTVRRVVGPQAPGAHPHGGVHRERVGGAVPGSARARGGGSRPELLAHVRHAQPQGEDGQARRSNTGRGVQAWGVQAGPPYLGRSPAPQSAVGGEKQSRGRITKTGNARVRWLLVQAALSILRRRQPQTEHLRTWAERIASRRGKKTAVVALARKLAGILFAMMREGTPYTPPRAEQAAALHPEAAAA